MRSGGSRGHWAAILSGAEPDLLFAQETRDPAQLVSGGSQAAWRSVEHGRWGSALFAPGADVAPIAIVHLSGWVVGAHVKLANLEFFAFSVHLPPTKSSYVRTADLLLDSLAEITRGEPCVLAGDWNFSVSPRAVGDPHRNRRSESRILTRLAEEFGLSSAWSICNPDQPLPQTLRWSREPTHPYHCDGIFVPEAWREALVHASVLQGADWTTLSDHNPVVAELNLSRLGPV